jgi:hypothetical protein
MRLSLGFVAAAAIARAKGDRRVRPLRAADAPLGRAEVAAPAAVCKVAHRAALQVVVASESDEPVGAAVPIELVRPVSSL